MAATFRASIAAIASDGPDILVTVAFRNAHDDPASEVRESFRWAPGTGRARIVADVRARGLAIATARNAAATLQDLVGQVLTN